MPKRKSLKRGVKADRKRPSKAPPYVVFISHSSSDSWIANQMSKEMEALGAETWLDTMKLLGGDNIRGDREGDYSLLRSNCPGNPQKCRIDLGSRGKMIFLSSCGNG
jgi:hypothetical protein